MSFQTTLTLLKEILRITTGGELRYVAERALINEVTCNKYEIGRVQVSDVEKCGEVLALRRQC